jgi:FlaA1/EpsC-like NDP-sugar epimerase
VLPYIGNSCKKSSCTSFDVNNIILVRGATGNIGIEVVKQLSAAQMGSKAAVQSEQRQENTRNFN